MKNIKNHLTLGQVAQKLQISNNTIKRWYDWYEDETTVTDLKLPEYQYLDKRGTKFFNISDYKMFEDFGKAVRRGGTHFGAMSKWRKGKEGAYSKKFKWVDINEREPNTLHLANRVVFYMMDGCLSMTYDDSLETALYWAEIPLPKIESEK